MRGEACEAASRAALAEALAMHGVRVTRGESHEEALRAVLRRVARLLAGGSSETIAWGRVDPEVLGAIYQRLLVRSERRARGVHFTGVEDVACVVGPTIEAPWRRRIAGATTAEELADLHGGLLRFTVLDPACGSGNFLAGALRALWRVEAVLRARLAEFGVVPAGRVGARQCVGIDSAALAAELTRATLRLVDGTGEEPRVLVGDALFMAWPAADAIVGNPPFGAKNKLVAALGREYLLKLRAAYPQISGRADYCVYFIKRAHDALRIGGRAGLIGTNTIRQNDSRAGGLDHVVANGGEIVDAVATRVWPGEAAVHVSVVNWIKGPTDEPRVLARQLGDDAGGAWERRVVPRISASLGERDVTRAEALACNLRPKRCFQGQTYGCKGFLIGAEEVMALGAAARRWVAPCLIGDDLLGRGRAGRYVVDLSEVERRDELNAELERRLAARVLPEVRRRAEERPHDVGRRGQLATWWRFWRPRAELVRALREVTRYVVCVRVTRRPIFAFVDAGVRPNDALQAFVLEDDYSFGVLQSRLHWQWFVERCSTLRGDQRYTSETVWSSFPWPQAPRAEHARAVAAAGRELRAVRDGLVAEVGSLRAVYRGMPERLSRSQAALDGAVMRAYGFAAGVDEVAALFELNLAIAAEERAGRDVQGPGVPRGVDAAGLRSEDRVRVALPWDEMAFGSGRGVGSGDGQDPAQAGETY